MNASPAPTVSITATAGADLDGSVAESRRPHPFAVRDDDARRSETQKVRPRARRQPGRDTATRRPRD